MPDCNRYSLNSFPAKIISYNFFLFLNAIKHFPIPVSFHMYVAKTKNGIDRINLFSWVRYRTISSSYFLRYTGLTTKDETSETILRDLFCPFSCIQGLWLVKTEYFLCSIECRNQKSIFKLSYFRVLGRQIKVPWNYTVFLQAWLSSFF